MYPKTTSVLCLSFFPFLTMDEFYDIKKAGKFLFFLIFLHCPNSIQLLAWRN